MVRFTEKSDLNYGKSEKYQKLINGERDTYKKK